MQIHKKILVASLFLGGFLGACSGVMSNAGSTSSADSRAAVGQPLSCSVGGKVSVTLAANPSTGFSWSLADRPDDMILGNGEQEFRPASEGLVGAGGESVWTFDCVASGTTRFTLVYRRVWESGVPPAKTMRYEVRVSEPS